MQSILNPYTIIITIIIIKSIKIMNFKNPAFNSARILFAFS